MLLLLQQRGGGGYRHVVGFVFEWRAEDFAKKAKEKTFFFNIVTKSTKNRKLE
jgi:hypothetical protein